MARSSTATSTTISPPQMAAPAPRWAPPASSSWSVVSKAPARRRGLAVRQEAYAGPVVTSRVPDRHPHCNTSVVLSGLQLPPEHISVPFRLIWLFLYV